MRLIVCAETCFFLQLERERESTGSVQAAEAGVLGANQYFNSDTNLVSKQDTKQVFSRGTPLDQSSSCWALTTLTGEGETELNVWYLDYETLGGFTREGPCSGS